MTSKKLEMCDLKKEAYRCLYKLLRAKKMKMIKLEWLRRSEVSHEIISFTI